MNRKEIFDFTGFDYDRTIARLLNKLDSAGLIKKDGQKYHALPATEKDIRFMSAQHYDHHTGRYQYVKFKRLPGDIAWSYVYSYVLSLAKNKPVLSSSISGLSSVTGIAEQTLYKYLDRLQDGDYLKYTRTGRSLRIEILPPKEKIEPLQVSERPSSLAVVQMPEETIDKEYEKFLSYSVDELNNEEAMFQRIGKMEHDGFRRFTLSDLHELRDIFYAMFPIETICYSECNAETGKFEILTAHNRSYGEIPFENLIKEFVAKYDDQKSNGEINRSTRLLSYIVGCLKRVAMQSGKSVGKKVVPQFC